MEGFDIFSAVYGTKLPQNSTRNLVDLVAVHRKARKKRGPGGRIQNFRPLGPLFLVEVEFVGGVGGW